MPTYTECAVNERVCGLKIELKPSSLSVRENKCVLTNPNIMCTDKSEPSENNKSDDELRTDQKNLNPNARQLRPTVQFVRVQKI